MLPSDCIDKPLILPARVLRQQINTGSSSKQQHQHTRHIESTKPRCLPLPQFRPARQKCFAAHEPPIIPSEGHVPRLAVFVSGGGSNFRAIHAAILAQRIQASIAVVVSDIPHCEACQYAAQNGIPIIAYPASEEKVSEQGENNAASPEHLRELLLEQYNVNFVILAGYLKLVPAEVVAAFPRAMLNIHPGLLPAFGGKGFYGSKVHKAVIKSGARFTGPTVHFVDEGYDTGPILAQRVVPVSPLETHKQIAAKVLKEEHELYPEAVAALVGNRISWREDGIPVLWSAD